MTRLYTFLASLAGAAAFLLAFWRKAQSVQQTEAEHDQMQDTIERTQQGAEAVRDGRASGDSPDDRVRKNDGQW